MQQTSLFHTGKERESKLREMDRKNQQAARIILEQGPGGLMGEWAHRVLAIDSGAKRPPPIGPAIR